LGRGFSVGIFFVSKADHAALLFSGSFFSWGRFAWSGFESFSFLSSVESFPVPSSELCAGWCRLRAPFFFHYFVVRARNRTFTWPNLPHSGACQQSHLSPLASQVHFRSTCEFPIDFFLFAHARSPCTFPVRFLFLPTLFVSGFFRRASKARYAAPPPYTDHPVVINSPSVDCERTAPAPLFSSRLPQSSLGPRGRTPLPPNLSF